MLANKLMSSLSGSGIEEKLYVDDVFSTYLHTGTGSYQTITNGIDLSGKGGAVFTKSRSVGDWQIEDTVRGIPNRLAFNLTDPQNGGGVVGQYNANGFTVFGNNAVNYVHYAFRKAPKFFDVVTYTGNGVNGRQITHSLGVAPGCIMVKRTDAAGDWFVYHQSAGATKAGLLNSTGLFDAFTDYWSNTTPTSTQFSLGTPASSCTNINGATYVAYLFAHDPSADGIIQCGSYTNDTANNVNVTLGWEPQFVLVKCASSGGNWKMMDIMRGASNTAGANLTPNTSSAETTSDWCVIPTATGFQVRPGISADVNGNGTATGTITYIYLAIRRPNKPPTSGTQVYQGAGLGITSAAGKIPNSANFPVDMFWQGARTGEPRYTHSRLTGFHYINPTNTSAEATTGTSTWSYPVQDGIGYGSARDFTDKFVHQFRRAPGFFDVVCYTGTYVANATVSHNLTVAPELVIVKGRTGSPNPDEPWVVQHSLNTYLVLNTTNAAANGNNFVKAFGKSSITLGTAYVNNNGEKYVAYLFATLPGISKVGSYTGNGTTQTINCGFTTGARFILIKRADSTGDWYIWDTARGIVSANDPHLSLNTTASEVTTDDSVDPDVSGFIVNQVAATNINVSGGQYIFLAIA